MRDHRDHRENRDNRGNTQTSNINNNYFQEEEETLCFQKLENGPGNNEYKLAEHKRKSPSGNIKHFEQLLNETKLACEKGSFELKQLEEEKEKMDQEIKKHISSKLTLMSFLSERKSCISLIKKEIEVKKNYLQGLNKMNKEKIESDEEKQFGKIISLISNINDITLRVNSLPNSAEEGCSLIPFDLEEILKKQRNAN
jgi:hypothetical protein